MQDQAPRAGVSARAKRPVESAGRSASCQGASISREANTPDLVQDQRRLAAHCRRWRAAGQFAFDTEFIRDESYDAQLCLVQVATADEEVVLVDPTAELDVRPFWDLVADETVTTIVHAGKEDFEVCLRATGRPPRNVFDVQIAAGFAGLG